MDENVNMNNYEESDDISVDMWDLLTPEQKEEFKKNTEKNKDNLSYIG